MICQSPPRVVCVCLARRTPLYFPALRKPARQAAPSQGTPMKVLSSLKSAKSRHRDCKIVRRRGKIFVICKSNPRFKARQR